MPNFIPYGKVKGVNLIAFAQILDILGDCRGFWSYLESSGTSVEDLSISGNDLSTAWDLSIWSEPVKRRNLVQYYSNLTYDVTQFLACSDTNDLSFGDGVSDVPFSVGIWVYLVSDSSPNVKYVIGKNDFTTGDYEWELRLISSSYIRPTVLLNDAAIGVYIYRTYNVDAILADTWRHLVFTYDGAGLHTGIKIYCDGVQIDNSGANTGGYVAMHNTAAPFGVGAMPNGGIVSGELALHGSHCCPFVTAKELSADEIWNLYLIGRGLLNI
jgi:hypothetical protein